MAEAEVRLADKLLLDGTHADRAHLWVKQWALEWAGDLQAVVEKPPSVPATMVVGPIGVRVTLRQAGGRGFYGDAYVAELDAAVDADAPIVDMGPLVQRATIQALVRYDAHARQLYAQADAVRADPNRPPYRLTDALRDLMVDVQIAHDLESIQLPAAGPKNELQTRFAAGFHGLRLVAGGDGGEGGGEGAFLWPATAVALNLGPADQLFQLMSKEGVPIRDLQRVARPGGPRLQRFEVIHIADTAVAMPPRVLTRGNIPLPASAVTVETLQGITRRIASHMLRSYTSDGRVRGTYKPTYDRYEPAIAPSNEAALSSYALLRYLGRDGAEGAPAGEVRTVMQAVTRLGQQQVGAGRNTPDAVDLPTVALTLLTLVDAPAAAAGQDELRDGLGELLLSLYTRGGGFRETAAEGAPLAHPAQSAMATAAVAAWYEQTRRPEAGEVTGDALDTLWLIAGERDPMVSVLPWYTLAHTRAARLLADADDPTDADRLQAREVRLIEMLAQVGRTQVQRVRGGDPVDIVGGFALGDPPQVSWYSAYPLWFLAQALGDRQLRDRGNVHDWLITARLAGRFIGQLMISESHGFYLRQPQEAMGGIRLTLWDNSLAIEPNAYSLLAATTLLEAIANLEQGRAADEPAPAPEDPAGTPSGGESGAEGSDS